MDDSTNLPYERPLRDGQVSTAVNKQDNYGDIDRPILRLEQ